MIVIDVNLLIYAYDEEAPDHKAARRVMLELFRSSERIIIPIQAISAFLRIMTNSRLPGRRLSMKEAVEIVDEWMDRPHVRTAAPAEEHWLLFKQMLIDGQATSRLITDAHFAAIAIETGSVLYTADRNFARFPGLRWKNPLTAR